MALLTPLLISMSNALARRGVIHLADKKVLMLAGNKTSGTFYRKKSKIEPFICFKKNKNDKVRTLFKNIIQ